MSKLKVLIVDDSLTMRQLMHYMIEQAGDMEVVGEAHDGIQAIEMTAKLRPDVVLMDIVMPQMDGLDATREIMHTTPTPIVMVTASLDKQETDVAFRALRLGALTVMQKPPGPGHPRYNVESTLLISAIRAMSGVKVIHHRMQQSGSELSNTIESEPKFNRFRDIPNIIAIAVSTGGPAALSEILKMLPEGFHVPIVIVQHISAEFLPSLIEWLRTTTSIPITIAAANERVLPGKIYFAPGNYHLSISKSHRFVLDNTPGLSAYMPSGDVLLKSVAQAYGEHAIGVVLTGMGDDGARGLKAMRDVGAYTMAQDEATSVVYGMPQEAAKLRAAVDVFSLKEIATTLMSIETKLEKGSTN